MSNIEWTGKTWNPIVGCSKISAGCQNCYAINQAYRNAAIGKTKDNPGRLAYYDGLTEKRGNRVEWTGKVAFVPEALEIPLKTKKPTTWFVNSMSDLFHESVKDEQLDQVFAVMALTPQHTYQCLTKRPQRMLEYMNWCERRHNSHGKPTSFCRVDAVEAVCREKENYPHYDIPQWPLRNAWLGLTVENQATAVERRIPLEALSEQGWFTWVSHEPALEQVDFTGWEFIRWLVMGGESGPGARPFDVAWPRSVIKWAADNQVDCFLKQLGAFPRIDIAKGIGPECIKEQSRLDSQWPKGTTFGNPTGNPDLNGSIALLKSRKGNDPDEWPEDLRVRQIPSVEVKA
jgi:protein gp37